MSNASKNILITPNTKQSSDPKIEFSGSTSSPTDAAQTITLTVLPDNNGTLSFTGSKGQLFSIANTFTGDLFSVTDNSGVPVFNITDTGDAQLSGTLRVYGNVYATNISDRRYKENIVQITDATQKVQSINGVYYDWTDEYMQKNGGEDGYFISQHDVGVIAQEVEPILPEAVVTNKDGIKAVYYQKLIPLLIESIKELNQKIQTLEDQVQTLSGG